MAMILGVLLFLSGCGDPFWLPPAHKIEIQQGNLLTEAQIQSIEVGMTRESVRALIGAPVSQPTFQGDRWDYAFTRGPVGSTIKARQFAVYFDNDIVTRTQDNFDTETGERVVGKTWFQKLFPVKESVVN